MEPAFKITMRYSLGTSRGQRKFSRKGVYVFKSKRKLQWSLPLKSPGDIHLDPAGVKGNPRVRGVYVFESQRKQWWSLPLKSLEDNLLDLAKFERESWVKGV